MRILVAVAVLMAVAPAAHAADVARGKALALHWCTTCHVVAPDATGGDAGPAFAAVASRPGETEGTVKGWLADPHPPMPDLALTAAEFDDLAAYIMSLRK